MPVRKHESHGSIGQTRRLGGALAPRDARVWLGCIAHGLIWLDRDDGDAAIGKQSSRDAGSRADVGSHDLRRITEARRDGGDRVRRIARATFDIVVHAIGEAFGGVQFVVAGHGSYYRANHCAAVAQ